MTGTPADLKIEHHPARRMTGTPAGPKTECHPARRTRDCHPIGAVRCRYSRRRTPAMGCHRSVARWTGSALPTGSTGWKCCRPTTRFAAVPAPGTGSPASVPGSPARPTAKAATSRGCRRTNSATRVKTMGTRARTKVTTARTRVTKTAGPAYPTSGSPSCSRRRTPGWPENRVSRILTGSSSHRPRANHPGGRTPGPNVPAHCLEPAFGFRVQCVPVEPAAAGALTAVSGTTARSFPSRNERSCSDS